MINEREKAMLKRMVEHGKKLCNSKIISDVPQVKLFESKIGIQDLENQVNSFLLENTKLKRREFKFNCKNIQNIDIQYNNGYWLCWVKYIGNIETN